ncbi:hypothetical protein H0H92_006841 [Tricholoma furcatifolium]|nr:hypothetical protein H0H92_006841 [Tricholoma furcatifolium]
MDNWPDGVTPDASEDVLSYDDTPYEEQLPTNPHAQSSLANRIGNTKVYLLSETSVARAGKRKHSEEEEEVEEEMDDDMRYRGNAILLCGPPIAHLPTARLFAYAKHFGVQPMGLEWVDDNTCVFVFPTKNSARLAHRHLQKSATEDSDENGFVTAKSIPIAFWPPEERINSSLGKGEGLKGTIRMRWALVDDVKKKGARKESAFYKKHGVLAGKEAYGGEGMPAAKRPRTSEETDLQQRIELDEELDEFLKEEEPSTPPSPPSKMRSDYISTNGKTLLERTSAIRVHDPKHPSLADRLTAPQRTGNATLGAMHSDVDDLSSRISSEKLEWGPKSDRASSNKSHRSGGGEKRSRRGDRREERRGDQPSRYKPRKMTQQELDDDIDAFLNEKE